MNHYSTIYPKTKKDSDKAMPIQKQIVSDYFKLPDKGLIITDATFDQDTKACTDVLITNPNTNKSLYVGVRKRTYTQSSQKEWLKDVSIRSELIDKQGNKRVTEIDKLAQSGCKLIVYTWMYEDYKPIVTYLVNVSKLIPYLDQPSSTKPNFDGSTANYYTAIDEKGNNQPWVIDIIKHQQN